MTGSTSGTLKVDSIVGGYLPGVNILNGCSLTAADEEIVVVVGPNGAGKSTLIKAMFGLLRISEGRVMLDGSDITNAAPNEIARRGMSYVPQVENVFPSLTISENLEMGGIVTPGAVAERTQEMFALFPRLEERKGQRAGTLSGGERQMLAMGRALMSQPSVLLLDEPSAGLAPSAVSEVFETVQRINAEGVTIVMIEQNARRALALADRGYVLESGRNRYDGSGERLLADPKVAELYLGGAAPVAPTTPGGIGSPY